MELTYHTLYKVSQMRYRDGSTTTEPFPIGFWFEVDGCVRWEDQDPPDLIHVGKWIASYEPKFEKTYRTARRECGFAIIFTRHSDANKMQKWLDTEDRAIDNEAHALVRMHRRRNKYQQLPGTGDREWSAKMDKNSLKPLRVLAWSPFASLWSDDMRGPLYLPVAPLRAFQLRA
jgi:hypothetical protein